KPRAPRNRTGRVPLAAHNGNCLENAPGFGFRCAMLRSGKKEKTRPGKTCPKNGASGENAVEFLAATIQRPGTWARNGFDGGAELSARYTRFSCTQPSRKAPKGDGSASVSSI